MATGSPRFRVKYMPTSTGVREFHTETTHETLMLCIGDDTDTFILRNVILQDGEYIEDLEYYSDPITETAILRSGPDVFEQIVTGPASTGRLEWSGGSIFWNTCPVELLLRRTEPVLIAVGKALAYTTSFNGAPLEVLVDLELVGPVGQWRLTRSVRGSGLFTLTDGDPAVKLSA